MSDFIGVLHEGEHFHAEFDQHRSQINRNHVLGLFDKLRAKSKDWNKTIVAVEPPSRLRNAGIVNQGAVESTGQVLQDTIKVRLAHNDERSAEARLLMQRRYQSKGYVTAGSNDAQVHCPESITLATYRGDSMLGTLTVGFDVGQGILADQLYRAELNRIRVDGRKLCEFTKLAIDNKHTSKYELGGLFHMAFLYAEHIWGYTDIVIEVNPAHANFYKRMLGFVEFGPERMCDRVNAPAVLLRLDTKYAREQIDRVGGHPGLGKQERSLYPYFLSGGEEAKVLEKFM